MRNWQRWALTSGLAFFGGIVQCASDSVQHSVSDYVRHGFIGLGPAIAALQLTLNQGENAAAAAGGK